MNPMMLIAKAQQSWLLRWLLGLNGFSIMPSKPGDDPMRRIQVRMMTTVGGLLTLLVTLIVGVVAGITALVASTPRPVGWIMVIAGGVLLLSGLRPWLRSRAARMPTPGVLSISLLLNLAAVAGGLWILR